MKTMHYAWHLWDARKNLLSHQTGHCCTFFFKGGYVLLSTFLRSALCLNISWDRCTRHLIGKNSNFSRTFCRVCVMIQKRGYLENNMGNEPQGLHQLPKARLVKIENIPYINTERQDWCRLILPSKPLLVYQTFYTSWQASVAHNSLPLNHYDTHLHVFYQDELNSAVASCHKINIYTIRACPPKIARNCTISKRISGPKQGKRSKK